MKNMERGNSLEIVESDWKQRRYLLEPNPAEMSKKMGKLRLRSAVSVNWSTLGSELINFCQNTPEQIEDRVWRIENE